MTDSQVVAIGCIARALIKSLGMLSENLQRAHRGESVAYTMDEFKGVIEEESVGWHQIMSMLRGV